MKKTTITTESGRYFLTDYIREEVDFRSTPQSRGIRPPPVQKPVPPGSTVIPLPGPENWAVPPTCKRPLPTARVIGALPQSRYLLMNWPFSSGLRKGSGPGFTKRQSCAPSRPQGAATPLRPTLVS